MADGRVKTLQVFSRVETDRNAIIKSIKLGKRREVILVSSGDEFLHFLEGEKLLQTVRLFAPVLCADVCSCDGKKIVLALSEDGKVWAVPIPEKKSKKSKSNQASIAFGTSSHASTSLEQDIFSGLLPERGGCLSVNTDQQNLKGQNSSVVSVAAESFIIFEPNAECALFVDGNIITSGWSESGVTISLYKRTGIKSEKLMYPALPTSRITLPMPDKLNSMFHKSDSEDFTCRFHADCQKMSLMCIYPSEAAERCSSLNPACLKDQFFGQLFGGDSLLLNSLVLLIGCGTGQVYFTPSDLHQEQRTAQGHRNSPTAEQHCVSFSPKLLYDLEEDLVGIHLVNLSSSERKDHTTTALSSIGGKENSKTSMNAMLFVGSRGKLVLAEENHSDRALVSGVTFSVSCVPAPVLCSSISSSGKVLIYSTGMEIFVMTLCSAPKATACALQNLQSGLVPKCIVLPNVCAMNSAIKPQRHKSETGIHRGEHILGLTFGGKLLEFALLGEGAEATGALNKQQDVAPLSMNPELATRKVKDALINIDEVSKQMSKVQLVVEAADEVLKQVNITMNIVCDSVASPVGFGSTKGGPSAATWKSPTAPFTCSLTPQVRLSDGSQNSVVLQCSFTSQSRQCLSDHWRLLVLLHGCKPWLSPVEEHHTSVSHSFSLGKFSPGSTRQFIIPLDVDFDVTYSVSAEVVLLCDLHSILARVPANLHTVEFLPQNAGGITVPVKRAVFDVLHFLRPQQVSGGSDRGQTCGRSMHKLLGTLQELNSIYQGLNLQDGTGELPGSTKGNLSRQQIHSVSLHLSQNCTDHIKLLTRDKFRESPPVNQPSSEPITDTALLFLFFLADSGLTPQQVPMSCSSFTMETVSGEPLTLNVRRFSDTAARASCSEFQVTGGMELSVSSPSMQLLSSAHEAVLKRLEPVISRPGKRAPLPLHHIQKAAKQLEDLQGVSASLSDRLNKRKHRSQLGISHGEGEMDAHLVTEVWQLYQQLRQVQLILP